MERRARRGLIEDYEPQPHPPHLSSFQGIDDSERSQGKRGYNPEAPWAQPTSALCWANSTHRGRVESHLSHQACSGLQPLRPHTGHRAGGCLIVGGPTAYRKLLQGLAPPGCPRQPSSAHPSLHPQGPWYLITSAAQTPPGPLWAAS